MLIQRPMNKMIVLYLMIFRQLAFNHLETIVFQLGDSYIDLGLLMMQLNMCVFD
jgi:hypothetical protein